MPHAFLLLRLSALAVLVFGVRLFPLRLVSFTASLGCRGCPLLVRRERQEANEQASSRPACSRQPTGLAELADTCACGLAVPAADASRVVLVRFGRSRLSWTRGCPDRALSAHQADGHADGRSSLVYAITADWRRGLALAGACAVVFGGATWVLGGPRGMVLYYVFGLPARIQQVAEHAAFWRKDIFAPMPLASASPGLSAQSSQTRVPADDVSCHARRCVHRQRMGIAAPFGRLRQRLDSGIRLPLDGGGARDERDPRSRKLRESRFCAAWLFSAFCS